MKLQVNVRNIKVKLSRFPLDRRTGTRPSCRPYNRIIVVDQNLATDRSIFLRHRRFLRLNPNLKRIHWLGWTLTWTICLLSHSNALMTCINTTLSPMSMSRAKLVVREARTTGTPQVNVHMLLLGTIMSKMTGHRSGAARGGMEVRWCTGSIRG
jgi:hypothetical protein